MSSNPMRQTHNVRDNSRNSHNSHNSSNSNSHSHNSHNSQCQLLLLPHPHRNPRRLHRAMR